MKTTELVMLAMLGLSTMVSAQAQTISSKDGFTLSVSDINLNVSSKISAKTDVSILKSKRFRNAEIEIAVPNLPEGISMKVEKDTQDMNLYHLTFSTNDRATEGKHTLILYGKHPHKRKGIMLKLNVSNIQGKKSSIVSTSN